MRLIISILLLMVSKMAMAQIHVINADSLKLGETAGTNGIAFYGNPYFKNIGLGKLSDSILVRQADGKIKFMPRSLMFSGNVGGSYIQASPSVAQDAFVGVKGGVAWGIANGDSDQSNYWGNLFFNQTDQSIELKNTGSKTVRVSSGQYLKLDTRNDGVNIVGFGDASTETNLFQFSSNGIAKFNLEPNLDTQPTQVLTRDATTGEVKYVPSTSFGGSGTGGAYIEANPTSPQNANIDLTGNINVNGSITVKNSHNFIVRNSVNAPYYIEYSPNTSTPGEAFSIGDGLNSAMYLYQNQLYDFGGHKYVKEGNTEYIQASPSTPQNANIDITGNIQNGGFYSAPGSIGLLSAPIGGTNHPNIAIGDHDTGINWYGDGDIALRGNGNDFIRFSQGSLLYFPVNPQLDVIPTQILTRDATTGEIKYLPSTSLQSSGTGATSVFGRIGSVTAQSEDYSSFYYPLNGNPSGFLTSVPAQSFASLTGKPTTLSGYGITDGASDANVVHTTGNETVAGNKSFTGATSASTISINGANLGANVLSVNGNMGATGAIGASVINAGPNGINSSGKVRINTSADNGADLQVQGKATVSSAPINPTDVVRLQDAYSGTYTPTVSGTSNISSTTPRECLYTKVGNIVTVSGAVTFTNSSTGFIGFSISLPITSSASTYEIFGTGSAGLDYSYASVAGFFGKAGFSAYNPSSTRTNDYYFSFQYIIK